MTEQGCARVVTVILLVIETVHTNKQGGLSIHRKSLYVYVFCGLSLSSPHQL